MPEGKAPFAGDAAARYDGWYATPWGAYAAEREHELFVAMARPQAGETALDVGCGTGRYLAWLRELGLEGFGADLSLDMLAVSSRRLKEAGAQQPGLVAADAAGLPFADRTFDLVLAVTVLEFVADERRTLAEMARVCRGRLFVGFLNRDSAHGRQIAAGEMGETLSIARLHSAEEALELTREVVAPADLTWDGCVLGPRVDTAREVAEQRALDAQLCAEHPERGAYIGVLARLSR
jgi:SAM-dependent methyltransferase